MSRATSRGKARVVEVCEAFAISRQAYYAAQAPESERPRRRAESPRAGISTPELLERIRAVVGRCAAWGMRKVWAYLRHIERVVVSRRRGWKVMKAHGLVLPASGPERRENLPRGQVVVPQSNRRWATDLTIQATVRDGVVAIVPVVDCGDRVVLAIELTKSQEAPAVLRPGFRSACEHTERSVGSSMCAWTRTRGMPKRFPARWPR